MTQNHKNSNKYEINSFVFDHGYNDFLALEPLFQPASVIFKRIRRFNVTSNIAGDRVVIAPAAPAAAVVAAAVVAAAVVAAAVVAAAVVAAEIKKKYIERLNNKS